MSDFKQSIECLTKKRIPELIEALQHELPPKFAELQFSAVVNKYFSDDQNATIVALKEEISELCENDFSIGPDDRDSDRFYEVIAALRVNRLEEALYELERVLPDEFHHIGFAETIIKGLRK